MPAQPIHVYEALAQALTDHDVTTLFGLMGDANLFMADHFMRGCGGQFIPAAHEGSAVLMASAYAQVSGGLGVATITHGPALTNCVTALTEATRGRIPMVLLAGDTPTLNPRHLQSIDQREVVKATGAGFVQLRQPETATRDVARAVYRAKAERRPIVLNMPADFMWQTTPYDPIQHTHFDTPAYAPEGPVLDEAVGMIASARRPMILAGRGAIHARDSLIRLADRLEAPLATTLKAKALFTGHPYNLDIFGTLSTPATYEVIAQSDCLIVFGAALHDFTTDQGKLIAGKRIVQVDTNGHAIGHAVHPDAALVADAGLSAENFIYWLDQAEIPASGFTRDLDPQALTHHPPEPTRAQATGTVPYIPALERLEHAMPKDRILVTDGGRFMTEVWCRISAPDPQSFVATVDFGSIGLGLQEGIGAAIAAPDRPVVMFTGDGGFMMGGINEFNTAVRLGLNLTVILCNDAAYGAEHIQFRDRKMDPGLTTFDWPSFAATATALGGTGIEVRSLRELDAAIAQLDGIKGPALLELHLDPDHVPRMRI
ncbi:MAG: thiamine pyrophosphate-binding protein [Pelagimonas sp.]|jgi:thiamine pyrophosphate-dependent acetolactate synthase large subunit-like protein|nr:thiamine pyrophosphate-binding protein [Pelagimonas sp.]